MILDIIYNISLLLSVAVIFAVVPSRQLKLERLYPILMGVVIGGVGILLMSRPVVYSQGLVFDGRSILLSVSGMFFGLIPTSIAAIIMIPYRIWIGGDGALMGVFVISTASAIGIIWHRKRLENFMESKHPKHIELLAVGFSVHVVMLICILLLPRSEWSGTFRYMSFPILVIYPIGSYLLSMLLYHQRKHFSIMRQLEQSEYRFRAMFLQSPIGITITDSISGLAYEVNQSFLDIMGMTREEHAKYSWTELTHPDDLAEDLAFMKQLTSGEIDSYAMDKRFMRPDGTYVWVHMAVTAMQMEIENRNVHLCMVMDISARKEMEQAILWANRHDVLTGIENLQAFEQALYEADTRKQFPLSVLIGDVNGLKVVNDAFGREAGDELLIAVAQVMKRNAEGRGSSARIGGDEFAMVLPETSEKEAWELAQQIQREVGRLGVRNVRITISFGVSVKQVERESLNELLKQAENALRRSKLTESPSAHSRAVHTIISTLHEKNRREELHSRRVSVLSVRLAEVAGMGTKEAAELRTAGLLHDIGKIAIDDSVLNKQGKLTAQEWEEVKRHPEIGWRILGSVGELGELANYILSHHERMDGKGYPRGLSGQAIPIPSRIIAIADAYDAMTAPRPYRESISDAEAAAEIKRCAGSQFDTNLARLFVEQVLEYNWDELP